MKMKQILFFLVLCTGLTLTSQAWAANIECQGKVTGNREGMAQVKVHLDEGEISYKGPHGSIDLPSQEWFQLGIVQTIDASDGNSYYVADASRSGHGGETNIFFIQAYEKDEAGSIESTSRRFVYKGSYGYRLEGILDCN